MFLRFKRENSKLRKQLKVQAKQLKVQAKQLKEQAEQIKEQAEQIKEQAEQLKAQAIIIDELKAQITELISKLAKNSNNSHKPPTSDNLSDRKQDKKIKKTKGKKSSGGQKNHKGVTLKISSEVDEKIVYSPEVCDICGDSLIKEPIESINEKFRQEVDIAIKKLIKNHHIAYKICPKCKVKIKGQYPIGINSAVQYSNNVQVISAYMSVFQMIPSKRLKGTFKDLFKLVISEGSIYNWNTKVASKVKKSVEIIKQNLLDSDLIHIDETGCYIEDARYWAYVFSNELFTFLDFNKGRSKKALNEIGFLPEYNGKIVTDYYSMYQTYSDNIENYFCNAHLLRDLTFIEEIEKREWAKKMKTILLEIKNLSENQTLLYPFQRYILSKRYDIIIENGLKEEEPYLEKLVQSKSKQGRKKQTKSKNILDRMKKQKRGILGFAYYLNVPFTNNLAERDLRFLKVKQKISNLFRSKIAAKEYFQIASFISTAKKQNLPVWESLYKVMMDQEIIFMN